MALIVHVADVFKWHHGDSRTIVRNCGRFRLTPILSSWLARLSNGIAGNVDASEHLFNKMDKAVQLRMKLKRIVDTDCIQIGEVLDTRRQAARSGHTGAVHQQRNQRQPFPHRGLNFHAHRVIWGVEASRALLRFCLAPAGSNDYEDEPAVAQNASDMLAKISARRYVLDVQKDR
ncbi:MAG TPA: hypothetical protein VFL55_10605 [Acetobacteraceae bacterium]|nr:hypothetical protein [Acetobacteraceae bacterium]